MRVDTSRSVYAEMSDAGSAFNAAELRRARFLLRRLQFLEAKIRDEDAVSGGSVFAQMEIEALEWVLEDIGYITIEREREGS